MLPDSPRNDDFNGHLLLSPPEKIACSPFYEMEPSEIGL